MSYTAEQRQFLAKAVRRERVAQQLDKEPASRAAGVSSITWKRIEDAEGVRDASLGKVLASLDLPSPDELLANLDGVGQAAAHQPTSRFIAGARARMKPESERTPEERALLIEAKAETNRLASLARKGAIERPLIDLVFDGQDLAAEKRDPDISAYIRQVESAVVGLVGFDRLADAFQGRLMEQTVTKVNQAGLTEQFVKEIDRIRGSGIDGPEVNRLLAEWIAQKLDEPPLQTEFDLAAHRDEDDPKEDESFE